MKKQTRTRKGEIAGQILAAVGVAGMAALSMSSPMGARHIYKMLWRRMTKKNYSRTAVNRSLHNLIARGYMRIVEMPQGSRVELTEKGKAELFAYEIQEKILHHPASWDKKWRLLIFDIEEKRRKVRDDVRRTLLALGFYHLQDSVWVYPYECEFVLELLRTKYHVRHDALFVRADAIINDRWLKQHFHLE